MSTQTAENLGCNTFCRAGAIIDELSSGLPSEDEKESRTYLAEHPCSFILQGNCRLVELLIRKELGLSLDEHYHESPRMKEGDGR
ncbi:MAG: hypothetical protein Q7R60_00935 [bacterium]|nr:hypothetical protein [bacterium]